MGPLAADAIKVFGGRSWTLEGRDASKGSARKPSNMGLGTRIKKKSYGNIHSINDRGIHEIQGRTPLSDMLGATKACAKVIIFLLQYLDIKQLTNCLTNMINSQEMLGGVVPNGPGTPSGGQQGAVPSPGGNGGGAGASSGASSAAGSMPASPWSSPLTGRKSLVASSAGIQGQL